MEQVEHDPDFIMLSRQFKANAVELISVLEQKQSIGGRTEVLLETVPVHKWADIFVASFEISLEKQLSMLDSVDAKERLSKAAELVLSHLQYNKTSQSEWHGKHQRNNQKLMQKVCYINVKPSACCDRNQ